MVKAYPWSETAPEIWMLGSSDYGAQVAAHFGLPYAFAWFFTDGKGGPEALDLYRKLYQAEPAPSRAARRAVRVGAGGRDRGGGAASSFSSRARVRLLRDAANSCRWSRRRSPPRHPYTAAEARPHRRLRETAFVGTGPQVAERIKDLAKRLNVQEMAVVTWAYDEAVRHKSYRLLAKAMGLAPRA